MTINVRESQKRLLSIITKSTVEVTKDDSYIFILTHMQNFGKSTLQRYAITKLSRDGVRSLLLTQTYAKLDTIVEKMSNDFGYEEGKDFIVIKGVEKLCPKYKELVDNKELETIEEYNLQKALDENKTHDAHLEVLHQKKQEDYRDCPYTQQWNRIKSNRKPIFCVNAMFTNIGTQFGGVEKIFIDEGAGFFDLSIIKEPLELLETLRKVEFNQMKTEVQGWPNFYYIMNFGSIPKEDKDKLLNQMERKITEIIKDENKDSKHKTREINKINNIRNIIENNLFIKRSGDYYTLPAYYYILKQASKYASELNGEPAPQIIISSALARDNPLFQTQIRSYSDLLSNNGGFTLYLSGNISFIKEETEEEVKSIKPFYFYSIDDLPTGFDQSFGSNKLRSLFLKKYDEKNKCFKELKDSEIKKNASILWQNLYKHIFKELGFPNNANIRIWAITFESIHKSLEKSFPSWKFTSFGGKTQGVDPDGEDKAVLIIGDLSNKETVNSLESVYYKDKSVSDWFETTYYGFSVKGDDSKVKEFVWAVILRESIEYLMRGRGRIPVIHHGKLYKRKDNQDIVKRVFDDMKIVITKPRATICDKCGQKNIILNESKTIKCKKCKKPLWVG